MDERQIFAFVLMPFDESFADVYSIGIKEAAEGAGVRAERLDDQLYAEGMLERIYRQIEAADIIIADVTGRNPNVLYELGYAHAKEKLCILITDDGDNIPFDLKHRRHIVYGDSLVFLRTELAKHLGWAKEEIETLRTSQLRVELAASGSVVVDEYTAEGSVELTLDFHHESTRDSLELHGIYFYLQKDWQLTQDGRDCPKSNSDVESFNHRYLVRPPVNRIVAEGWAQLSLKGSRRLGTKWRGDELKDSYHLKGRCLVRLLTSKGNFDYPMRIEVILDDLPF